MDAIFEKKKNTKAAAWTTGVLGGLFLFFVLVSWTIQPPEVPLMDEGIEVNLGNSETGLGDIPPMIPGEPAPEPQEAMASTPQSSPPPEEPVTSIEDSRDADALVVPKKVEKTTTKPKATINESVATNKPKAEPPAPKPQKPKATMGTYTGGNGTGGNNQDGFNNVKNQGVAGGTGDQGKPNGNINSDSYTGNGGTGKSGVSISRGLSGRSITRFPSFEDEFNENAKVAVDLRVDENGNVVSATFQPRGSTTGNANLKAIAIRKAKQLKLSSGDGESIGTVIFNFRLKG